MRIQLMVLLACATAYIGVADGQQINVVSPSIYENAEAPTSNSSWPAAARVHSINSSSVFTALPTGGATLTEISLRPDNIVLVGEQISFSRVQISLSVTQVDPSNLSSTFAINITGTPIVVYDSSWSATVVNEDPTGQDPPGHGTRPFDFRIPLQTPYSYDPAEGNLLVDWIFETFPGVDNADLSDIDGSGNIDQQTTWTGSLGVDSPVSTGSRFSPVIEFTFVPEPSTLALAGLGLTAVVACFRRRML